jgi:hypothetical protein
MDIRHVLAKTSSYLPARIKLLWLIRGTKAVRVKSFKWNFAAVFVAGTLFQLCLHANAEPNNWESALATMKKGADQMIEGRKMFQQKKDLSAAEKMIKDGHRMMMESEKAAARIQKDKMKHGAKLMLDGLKALKAKNDAEQVEKQMIQGQEMILEAEKMMADTRIEKLMQGSRNMMRGLRMMQKADTNTANKLMTDGQSIMMEAANTMKDKK